MVSWAFGKKMFNEAPIHGVNTLLCSLSVLAFIWGGAVFGPEFKRYLDIYNIPSLITHPLFPT